MAGQLILEHHDAASATLIHNEIVALYALVRADQADNPYYAPERFSASFRRHQQRDGFELVNARLGGELAGVIYGFTELDGAQFALCELMVAPTYRRQGIARRLHDELLSHRPEPRAALYVRKDNVAAQAAYRSWGWRKIRDVQPTPEAPNYDELVVTLPMSAFGR